MAYHAKLSPSGAHRWSTCTASPGQSAGKPNLSSDAAMQGTAEHQISAECLENGGDPSSYVGRTMLFLRDADGHTSEEWMDTWVDEAKLFTETSRIKIDDDSAARCMAYIQFIRDLVTTRDATLMVEQRVPIGHITGEKDATGTSDSVILAGEELIIADAKFGRGKVTAYDLVSAAEFGADGNETVAAVYEPNPQLAMYADGSLEAFEIMGDFKTVRMIIVQPAINHVSEFAMPVAKLREYVHRLRVAAEKTRTAPEFVPTSDNCFFCAGRFDCNARNAKALNAAAGAFEDGGDTANALLALPSDTRLGTIYSNLPFIKRWAEDLESQVRSELEQGNPVVRDDGMSYALGDGKMGARQWIDEDAATEAISKMRLKDAMWKRSLISPTQAEKLTKPTKVDGVVVPPALGERQWKKVERLYEQKPGKPVIYLQPPKAASNSLTDLFK